MIPLVFVLTLLAQEAPRIVDGFMAKGRESGPPPGRERNPAGFNWDDFRRFAGQGHEFASHTVTHPYMTALDEANIAYEIEKSIEDIRENLGPRPYFLHRMSLRHP